MRGDYAGRLVGAGLRCEITELRAEGGWVARQLVRVDGTSQTEPLTVIVTGCTASVRPPPSASTRDALPVMMCTP